MFDILVPVALVYVYVANILSSENYGEKRVEEPDPMQMKVKNKLLQQELVQQEFKTYMEDDQDLLSDLDYQMI